MVDENENEKESMDSTVITLKSNINATVTKLQSSYKKAKCVSFHASGNAISKAITISEIMKRSDETMTVSSSLRKVPLPKSKEEEAEDEGFKNTPLTSSDRFLPCLEITIT